MRKFRDIRVKAVFDASPRELRPHLLALRALIFETAAETEGVGAIEEALRWGQPSYLTPNTKSGTTIRIDRIKDDKRHYGLYFHCQTHLVDRFRELYGDKLKFEGNRSIVLDTGAALPTDELRHCIAMALTYQLDKRAQRKR